MIHPTALRLEKKQKDRRQGGGKYDNWSVFLQPMVVLDELALLFGDESDH